MDVDELFGFRFGDWINLRCIGFRYRLWFLFVSLNFFGWYLNYFLKDDYEENIISCFFCLCFFFCEKDIFEKKFIIGVMEENFYKMVDDVVFVVNGVYVVF